MMAAMTVLVVFVLVVVVAMVVLVLIVIVVVPYVFHFNPVSIYLNWTAGNVANLLFPFSIA